MNKLLQWQWSKLTDENMIVYIVLAIYVQCSMKRQTTDTSYTILAWKLSITFVATSSSGQWGRSGEEAVIVVQ